jgi:hypothetical protein
MFALSLSWQKDHLYMKKWGCPTHDDMCDAPTVLSCKKRRPSVVFCFQLSFTVRPEPVLTNDCLSRNWQRKGVSAPHSLVLKSAPNTI